MTFRRSLIFVSIAVFVSHTFCVSSVSALSPLAEGLVEVTERLEKAGDNGERIAKVLKLDGAQNQSAIFLLQHMPEQDLKTLSADFLSENIRLAHQARDASAWKISDDLFLNYVLPYANVDETREPWRADMQKRAAKIVEDCKTPGEAAQRLNQHLFKEIGVKYSTKRKKANQCPGESIEQGLASCTGLSIILVDACRSVNVPARLVGVPSWTTKRGNHTWVEIWDNGAWHFTGAAEYNPKGLDKAWFVGDASKADKTSRAHSIYAISFKKTNTQFPIVWSRGGPKSYAINVTDRYTQNRTDEGADEIQVLVKVRSESNNARVQLPVKVCLAEETSEQCALGKSRGETADTNDILAFKLKRNRKYKITVPGLAAAHEFKTDNAKQQTVELVVALPADAATKEPAAAAKKTDSPPAGEGAALSKDAAAQLVAELHETHLAKLRDDRKAEWEAKVIKLDDKKMKFEYRTFGEKPENGHALYISMHGGGGAPPRVNESQWKNQIGLYEPKEGIYLAPRAPTDTWNLWHEKHIDDFFDRIIEDAVALADVDPNRVYIMGYSAGGDGTYQLAPRIADRLAAAAMMAGHPNDAKPFGLRNIGFTLHMGGKDGAYKRNKIAAEWKEKLAKLKADDPGGYEHEVVIHPDFGHWMNRKDAVAVEWMAKFTRKPLPEKVVWYQSGRTHERFYWLAAEPADQKGGAKMVVSRDGNEFTIHETDKVAKVIIRLNDEMIDFDKPVVVRRGETSESFEVKRSAAMIKKSFDERGDHALTFAAEIVVKVD